MGGYARVTSYGQVTRNSVAQHKNALNSGVLSIALAAGNRYFQQYRSGILNTSACGSRIDHAVNMVGWGSRAARTTGSSETPGAPAGETEATSSSLLSMVLVFAALSSTLSLSTFSESTKNITLKTLLLIV